MNSLQSSQSSCPCPCMWWPLESQRFRSARNRNQRFFQLGGQHQGWWNIVCRLHCPIWLLQEYKKCPYHAEGGDIDMLYSELPRYHPPCIYRAYRKGELSGLFQHNPLGQSTTDPLPNNPLQPFLPHHKCKLLAGQQECRIPSLTCRQTLYHSQNNLDY